MPTPARRADLGEVLVTCRQIPDGNEETWSTQWAATAARIESQGRASLDAGHTVSARGALLRASNYYRTADFFLREDPAHDAESRRLAEASQTTFADAALLLDHPARRIRIPYQDTTLPGYLFLPDDSGRRRSTLVDSTVEEAYHVVGAAATRSSIEAIMAASTQVRWMMHNARWTFGIDTLEEFGDVLADYTVRDIAADIVCPTLVLEGAHDAFFPGQSRQVFDLLQCPKAFISFPEDEGGGEHCQEGAMLQFQQETFDWLVETLAGAPERPQGA